MSKQPGSEPSPSEIWQEAARTFFSDSHPLFHSLGMRPLAVKKDGVSVSCLPDDSFRAGKNDQYLHSGVLTIILDSVFGIAVFARLQDLRPIATINLKMEYIKPLTANALIKCTANCYAVRGNIGHVRGEISDAQSNQILATATAAFMIGTLGPSFNPETTGK